jgi:hypothetical protein
MAYTQTSSLSVDQAAFDRLAYFALRSELLFDAAADVMPTNQAMPGSTVTFTIFNDLSAATSALTEDTDVTPVAMSDSRSRDPRRVRQRGADHRQAAWHLVP